VVSGSTPPDAAATVVTVYVDEPVSPVIESLNTKLLAPLLSPPSVII